MESKCDHEMESKCAMPTAIWQPSRSAPELMGGHEMATNIDNPEIPMESKRAMTTVALMTKIFQKYLEQHRCPYIRDDEELKKFSAELLDHVIIVGGFCRDILLNRAVNDIDIIINLRELTKLQRTHLKKYHVHSKTAEPCRCVYWQCYLQKLNADAAFVEAQAKLSELEMMHNLNYILNANFWIGVLRADKALENKLSVTDFPQNGYHSAQIVDDIACDSHRINITDTFHMDKALQPDESDAKVVNVFHRKSRQLSTSGPDINRAELGQEVPASIQMENKSRHQVPAASASGYVGRRKKGHGRLASMAMIDLSIDDMGGTCFGASGNKSRDEQQYIAIELPIYSGKVRYLLLNYDFSIDTCILPLSNIIKLKTYSERMTRVEMIEMIENGLGECDGIEDCTQERVLRSPSIQEHPHYWPHSHAFWRIVRWKIAQPDFKIDPGLVQAHQEDFGNWLTLDWFEQRENRSNFMLILKLTLEGDCRDMGDVHAMLRVMQELQFTRLFAQVVQQSNAVRRMLSVAIQLWCFNKGILLLERNAIKKAFGIPMALLREKEIEQGARMDLQKEQKQRMIDAEENEEQKLKFKQLQKELEDSKKMNCRLERSCRNYQVRILESKVQIETLEQRLAQKTLIIEQLSDSKRKSIIALNNEMDVLRTALGAAGKRSE